MKTTIMTVIVALLSLVGSQAASVSGRVSDSSSDRSLSDWSVIVYIGNDRYSAKTNSTGYYYIDIPDSRLGQIATLYVGGARVKAFSVTSERAFNVKFR